MGSHLACSRNSRRLVVVAWLFLLLCCSFLLREAVGDEDAGNGENNDGGASSFSSAGGCDDDAIDDATPLSKLTPNQFYKICPRQIRGDALGQPACGDGTNFAFFATKPIQRKANDHKVLVEFMGGGACWDAQTCAYNQEKTAFPEDLNKFVGYSCSEIAYSMDNMDGYPINMLCAGSVGKTDFSEYTTIVVPYCTQDVHLGDSTMNYDDMSVNHKGAHNVMGVLRWIFRNFNNPTHVVLTGCSAGGTVVPIVYDLIRRHYDRFGQRSVQISTIADSPVYLTPSYFLNNVFENWNPSTIMGHIGFRFNKWRYSSDYPTRTWSYVLKRGSKKDKWGFVSHTDDPISLAYYQWMSGQGEGQGDNDRLRQLNGDGDDTYSSWYSETASSLNTIESRHKNVKSYWLDSEGHCSFGLYYAISEGGDDFKSWAGSIVQEQRIRAKTPSVPLFLLSAILAILLCVGAYHSDNKREIELENDDGFLDDSSDTMVKEASPKKRAFSMNALVAFPITSAYTVVVTVYFWTMIISQGFAHPINNPSLGPSALSLSGFGINNPSLIVYQSQIIRLFVSSFLCSGVLTYFIVLLCLWLYIKPLERLLRSTFYFGIITLIILFGSNIFYAMVGNGATCSSVALVLGLNTVYIILRHNLEDSSIVGITIGTIFLKLLVCFLFPFNSWIILLTAVALGVFCATVVVQIASKEPHMIQEDGLTDAALHVNPVRLSTRALRTTGAIMFLMTLALLFRIRRPNRLYLQPFYTGCDAMFAAGDDVANLVSKYAGDNNDEHRWLEGGGGDDMCAQFCIPHIASRAVVYGTKRILDLSLTSGQCEDVGYDQHMADKTFAGPASYSMDFEIFLKDENNDENNQEEGGRRRRKARREKRL